MLTVYRSSMELTLANTFFCAPLSSLQRPKPYWDPTWPVHRAEVIQDAAQKSEFQCPTIITPERLLPLKQSRADLQEFLHPPPKKKIQLPKKVIQGRALYSPWPGVSGAAARRHSTTGDVSKKNKNPPHCSIFQTLNHFSKHLNCTTIQKSSAH